MAPSQKRRLSPSDESDDSISTPEVTEDLNVKGARKKIRRMEETTEESTEEQSEYEDLELETETTPHPTPSTSTHKQMEVSEYGTISRVEVVNFMCHKYLKVDFGPKINFVIGHNGSGKSAILTAITISLGAKATSTNRGKNLSSFIREGSNAALAVVHLTNRGPDAYKHDVYGDIIQIERKLLRDGSGGYKIKNSSGKIISTKREELTAICDHFSIQVDNPLTMLSQDNARQFLNASSSHEKYQLFMRGTQLGYLAEKYAELREHLEMMKSHIDRQKDILPDRQKRLKETEARYKQLLEAQEIDVKIDKKQEELAWAQIIGKEKEVERLKKEVDVAEQHVNAAREALKSLEREVERIENQKQAIQAECDRYKQSLSPSEEARTAIERQKVAKETELRTIHADISDVNTRVKIAKQQIAKYEQLIAAENAKLESSTQTKKRELQDRIDHLKAKKEEKEMQQKTDFERKTTLRAEYEEKKSELDEIAKKLQVLRSRDSYIKKRVQELRAQKNNGLKAYGSNMPDVLREIASETRWRGRTPVGPIGSYLKLKYPQYAQVLEIVLNKQLNAFIVENFADRQLLTKILQRNRLDRTPVIVAKYDLFPYEHGEPDEKYLTILRALEFDNEWVKRQLIISSDIEKTILMERRDEADDVMYSRPHNVKTCYTASCIQVGAVQGKRSDSMNPYRGPPRLTKDIEPEIQEAENELRKVAQEIRDLADRGEKVKYETLEIQRQISSIDNTQNTLYAEIARCKREIMHLEDAMKEEEPVNVQAYYDEKSKQEAHVEREKAQFAVLRQSETKVRQELQEIHQKLRQFDDEDEQKAGRLADFEQRIQHEEEQRQRLLLRMRRMTEKIEERNVRLQEVQGALRRQQRILEAWTQEAQEAFPNRIETTKTPEQLHKEVQAMEALRDEHQKAAGRSIDKVAEAFEKAAEAYNSAKVDIEHTERLYKLFKRTLDHRLQRWNSFRMYISLTASAYFTYYMHKRGDNGQLKFNHEKEKLELRVSTGDQFKKGTRHKDSKSLSGGEKSFSQVSLLLAMWQGITSPIFCLDEFDVYMDAVNRKQSMKMMMESAGENSSQYILITPQDASNMTPGPYVTVHRLADPERHQE